MPEVFNIYCDESCHLERDCQQIMTLGAIWCPLTRAHSIADQIRDIKIQHSLLPDFEIKWSKVSPSKVTFYLDLVNYFFDEADLHFRALIAPDKSKLQHASFDQTHDEWYFKMYFIMLKAILRPDAQYRIYIDIKDTRSAPKVERLWDVLCNNAYDFSRQIIERVQTVRSHEVQQLQLADLLTGAISYINRGLSGSSAKAELVKLVQQRSHYSLTHSTLYREEKVNLFRWEPQELSSWRRNPPGCLRNSQ